MSFRNRFEFYRSREWENLLAQLKIERANEDGQIICEYCQKPIVKAYDCIGHHKKELTEENVLDYEISLNPDNIAFVHFGCHNRLHYRAGQICREVYIIYGPPLAGKTSYVAEAKAPGDLILDIDSIWQAISGEPRYEKPGRLNAVVFAVRDKLLEAVKYRLGKWNNAWIIGGYPNGAERERLAKELGAREVLLNPGRAECIARLEANAQGRDLEAWRGFIDTWYERSGIDDAIPPTA